MGALDGSNTWQLFNYGFGPYPDGLFTQSNYLFTQSNYGIVTKMGIALMPAPPGAESFLITFENEEDLEQVIDIMLPLRIGMAPLQNVPVLRNIFMDAASVSQRTEWFDGEGPLPQTAIKAMQKDLNLGFWNLYGTVYGPPPQTEMFLGMIRDAFLQVPGARFFTHPARPAQDQPRHPIHRGTPHP